MTKAASQVRDDFDRIALSSTATADESQPYDRMVTSLIPPGCRRLLELGCGTGRLTNGIAHRVGEVTAVDFSPEMLRVARDRCAGHRNIAFHQADILDLPAGLGPFDCVVSVNLLHHLPVERSARTMKALVAPGGLLIVHDVRRSAGPLDRVLDAPRIAIKTAWLLGRVSRVRAHVRQRAAWAQHARGDVISTEGEIIRMRDSYFPGARLRQHFLWRYTLLWTERSGS